MDKKIQLVIFDLDGTLIDAYQAVYESINFCMTENGRRPVSHAKIKRTVGWGDRHLLAALWGEKDLDRVLRMYRRHHRDALKRGSKLLPGAREVLEKLRSRGYLLAVASNRPTKFSLIVLRHLGIWRHFDYVLCGDKARRPKPYPDILRQILKRFKLAPSQAMYVGDMTIDVEAGRRARVRTVAVCGGSSRKKELSALQPVAIIKSVAQLPDLLTQLDSAGVRSSRKKTSLAVAAPQKR